MTSIKKRIGKLRPIRFRLPSRGKGKARSRHGRFSPWAVLLVMFLFGLVAIVIEINDHNNMHIAHNTGQLLYQDRELVREIFMYGIVLPILGATLLLTLNRTGTERDQAVEELDHQRTIIEEIHQISDWDELVDRIVRFPKAILAATRSVLTVFDLDDHHSSFAAAWVDDGGDISEIQSQPLFLKCQSCLSGREGGRSGVVCCTSTANDSHPNKEIARYCLPMTTADGLVAVLNFDITEDNELNDHQRHMLTDVAPHMALALENVQLQHSKISNAEVAIAERQRIARDLHDTLGQNITYLRLKLDQLSNEGTLQEISAIQQEIEQMLGVADEAYLQVRQTLAALHPDGQRDITETLAMLADSVALRAGFNVHFESDGHPVSFWPHTKRQLLYICREAFNNIEKHADAHDVWVKLIWGLNDLTITIVDDGVGFDPEAELGEDNYGQLIMRQRATAINGKLSLISAPDQGTTVTILLPAAEEERFEAVRATTAGMEG